VPKNICRNCFHNMTIEPDGHPFFTPGPCFGVQGWTGYGVSDYGSIKGEKAMMKEIFARGPIPCNAATDDTFVYNYSTNEGILGQNVYVTDVRYTSAQIDHVMEVAGWGETDSGLEYWVVRNSWGTYWGDMGWVKIRRGVDQQLIESGGCDWAVPDVHEVDEQMKTRAMGDYIRGITTSLAEAAPQQLVAAAVQAKSEQTGLSREFMPIEVIALTVGSAAIGSFITRIVGRQTAPMQPSLLG